MFLKLIYIESVVVYRRRFSWCIHINAGAFYCNWNSPTTNIALNLIHIYLYMYWNIFLFS